MGDRCPVCGLDVRVDMWEGGTVRVESCGHHFKAVYNSHLNKDELDGSKTNVDNHNENQ